MIRWDAAAKVGLSKQHSLVSKQLNEVQQVIARDDLGSLTASIAYRRMLQPLSMHRRSSVLWVHPEEYSNERIQN